MTPQLLNWPPSVHYVTVVHLCHITCLLGLGAIHVPHRILSQCCPQPYGACTHAHNCIDGSWGEAEVVSLGATKLSHLMLHLHTEGNVLLRPRNKTLVSINYQAEVEQREVGD